MGSPYKAIYFKLSTSSGVTDFVGTSILPEYRENLIPSVIYDCDMDEDDRSYEGIICCSYEVTLSCIANTLADADELAAEVINAIDTLDWVVPAPDSSSEDTEVMGCWVEGKQIDEQQLGTRNVRIWVVELKAKLLVKGL